MTTKDSPLRVLKAQANHIGRLLAAFERGERVEVKYREKIEAARGRDSIKFAVVMDDKTIVIDIPWALIKSTGEVGLSEFILKQMRESRETVH